MRLTKEVPIGDKKIVVNELSVRQIKLLWKDLIHDTTTPDIIMGNDLLKKHWDQCVSGITLDETDDLAPSELKQVYDAFNEVNGVFFDLALRVIGENPFLQELRAAVMQDLIGKFVGLLKEDTPAPGTTDTVSSSSQ